MSDFLHYILHVSIAFAILYLLYRLCFSKLTFHTLNRTLMLVMLPLSLFTPWITIEISSNYLMTNSATPILFDDFGDVGDAVLQTTVGGNSFESFYPVIMLLYGIGLLVSLISLTLNIVKLLTIRYSSDSFSYEGFRYIKTNSLLTFSCFRWIFIPKNVEIENSIIEHEKLHAKVWHTLDLCIIELFIALLWFNPFVYLFRKDLKIMHEFQVDSMLLHKDIKKSDYLQLLLNNLVRSQKSLSLCNYFQGLTIKKRVEMITKEKSTKWKLLRYLLLIPVVALMTMSFSGKLNNDGDIPNISPIKIGDYDRISSTFGMRMHPIKKVDKFHSGIDFAATKGTKIIASANGLVTSIAFKEGSYGKMIIINHGGGYETWYTQMSDYTVKQGDNVKCGDVIGYVGSSGMSTGSHLHYEVRKDGNPVNPQDYIKN